MKISPSLVFIALTSLPVMLACNKHDRAYVPVDPQLKSLLEFQAGSYWIMQDSVTKEIDSFIVVRHLDYTSNSNTLNETIASDILEYRAGSMDSVAWWSTLLPYDKEGFIGYSSISHADVFSFPFYPTLITIDSGPYTANGVAYDSVVMRRLSSSGIGNVRQLDIGISCRTGLIYIKCDLGTYSHKWELLRGLKQ
jgi:hypothetical protein